MIQQFYFWAYSRENHNSKNTCTPMFIVALFTIDRTWKQPKRPSTEEWIPPVTQWIKSCLPMQDPGLIPGQD